MKNMDYAQLTKKRTNRNLAAANKTDLGQDELLHESLNPKVMSQQTTIHLQQTIGNQAVMRLLKKEKQPSADDEHDSNPFSHLVRFPKTRLSQTESKRLPSSTPFAGGRILRLKRPQDQQAQIKQQITPGKKQEATVQRGIRSGIKSVYKRAKNWLGKGAKLAVEAAGHFLQGIFQSIAGFGSLAAGMLPGVVTGIGGIVQIIIGICKSVRAHILRKNQMGSGEKSAKEAAKSRFKNFIVFEALLGTASAISGIVAGAFSPKVWLQAVSIVAKSLDTVGGIIKAIRGAFFDKLSDKTKGILIMIEAVIGFITGLMSNIATGIHKGAKAVLGIIGLAVKKIITLFKGGRGHATAYQSDANK
jgi:hypothetical protein